MYNKAIFASLSLYTKNKQVRYKNISFNVIFGPHLYSGVNLEDEMNRANLS